jgi:hypothetical protein
MQGLSFDYKIVRACTKVPFEAFSLNATLQFFLSSTYIYLNVSENNKSERVARNGNTSLLFSLRLSLFGRMTALDMVTGNMIHASRGGGELEVNRKSFLETALKTNQNLCSTSYYRAIQNVH